MGGGPVRVAGIGLNARATREGVAEVLARLGPSDRLATVSAKAARLAALAGRAVQAVDDLRGVPTPTHSPRVLDRFGTGSVAEACALRVAGRGARIVIPRITSACGTVTGAVAEGEGP